MGVEASSKLNEFELSKMEGEPSNTGNVNHETQT